jgi:UDP-N-acetylmuramate--alanine ligase
LTRRYTTYGFTTHADLTASDIEARGFGMHFQVRRRGDVLGSLTIPLPGVHNVANALASLAVALELEVPFEVAAGALEAFAGIERRFERKGEAAGVVVVDDYGHHPAEVKATLAAARAAHPGRLAVIFQPHRYTRTRDCFDDFATAFNDADLLVVTEIYAAGEDKIPGIDGRSLAHAIAAHGHRDVRFQGELDLIAGALAPDLAAGDLVITLGAGDVSSLGPRLLGELAKLHGDRR